MSAAVTALSATKPYTGSPDHLVDGESQEPFVRIEVKAELTNPDWEPARPGHRFFRAVQR